MVEQPRVATLSLVWTYFTVKALLNSRRDADVTEAMASSKSHLGSVGAHRNRGAFFDLSLCAKEQFLDSQDRRAPQRKGDSTEQSQRI